MREILFRGKQSDNKEWLYGSLIKRSIGSFIVDEENKCAMQMCKEYDFSYHCRLVDSKTVTQYTGVLDSYDKKIFEGDIVEVSDDYGNTNFSDGGIGIVEFFDGSWYINGDVQNGLYDVNKIRYIEVIGNIYDNPEMLVK